MVRKTGNMKVEYDPDFIRRLKKLNVRIRKSFKERIAIFQKDPFSPELDNHDLHDKWEGYRSINITSDWRIIYEEIKVGDEPIAYFIAIGNHKELYG